jgi:hypothetical protein
MEESQMRYTVSGYNKELNENVTLKLKADSPVDAVRKAETTYRLIDVSVVTEKAKAEPSNKNLTTKQVEDLFFERRREKQISSRKRLIC